ncbi:MAG: polysaccharide lyase family 7 protein [Bacteroidota bacterium]
MVKVLFIIMTSLLIFGCKTDAKPILETTKIENAKNTLPHDVIPFMDKWKILCGDGSKSEDLIDYTNEGFFYVEKQHNTNWVVYKTPNAGITSKPSQNTRTELHQKKYWTAKQRGMLTATLKVQHVSTSGDASVPSSYCTVIGQIHSADGHENEPLKIYYKKFPGHEKGSVFWNYEINTQGDNSGRWDFSTAVWGYNFSVLGTGPNTYPDETEDGIKLGEEFSYEVNVLDGVMYLTFSSENHETFSFAKSLIKSDFPEESEIPQRIIVAYSSRRSVSPEKENAYADELLYFKQGNYNQANPKSTKSEVYGGDIEKQYANGSYAEVWFREAHLGSAKPIKH